MLNTLVVDSDSIKHSFDRLVNFKRVNIDQDEDYKLEALENFLQAVGLDEEMRLLLNIYCETYFGPEFQPYIYVGALIGLSIAEDLITRAS